MTALAERPTGSPLTRDELDELLEGSYQSLRKIVRRTLGQFPTVRRWDETDDVLQIVFAKFHAEVTRKPPVSRAHFYGLAATMIRHKIIDLARKYNGPHGIHTNHQTNGHLAIENSQISSHSEQITLERWSEFHQHIAQLPEELREVVDLLWYGGLSKPEVAACLELSLSTVQRHWNEAKRLIAKETCGICPE